MNMFSIGSQVYFPFLKNNSITNISNNDSLNTNSILKKIEDNNQSSNKIFIKNQHENYAEDPFNQTFQIETSTILKVYFIYFFFFFIKLLGSNNKF